MTARSLVFVLAISVAAWTPAAVDLSGTTSAGSRVVADAVVWLDAPDVPKPATAPEVVLDQRNLRFIPNVLAVRVGTKVRFPNNDRVFHNVFSFHDGKPFDLGLYPVGAMDRVSFDRPGLSRIFCNIHPQMAAYVMVVDTPYFAVSDEAGGFVIRAVPAGTYRYHAWRPGGTVIDGAIDVGPGSPLHVRWP
jgi:plastocyanin